MLSELPALYKENSVVPRGFPYKGPVMQNLNVFFAVNVKKTFQITDD